MVGGSLLIEDEDEGTEKAVGWPLMLGMSMEQVAAGGSSCCR